MEQDAQLADFLDRMDLTIASHSLCDFSNGPCNLLKDVIDTLDRFKNSTFVKEHLKSAMRMNKKWSKM